VRRENWGNIYVVEGSNHKKIITPESVIDIWTAEITEGMCTAQAMIDRPQIEGTVHTAPLFAWKDNAPAVDRAAHAIARRKSTTGGRKSKR
jgi:hypothetical protein